MRRRDGAIRSVRRGLTVLAVSLALSAAAAYFAYQGYLSVADPFSR